MIHAALILAMTVGVSDRSRINGYDNSIAVLSTTGDITLAVTSTGSDSDTRRPDTITTGDYSAYPFATIQAAVDATPGTICHDTEIDVGTGTFAGALVSKQGCAASPDSYPWIRIYGTRAAATLASGSVSGTATSGGTSTLTLTGASWTVDDLQGRILYVTAGSGAGEYVIATNTTDTITIPAVATFDGTSVFQLEDLATVVNAPRAGYAGNRVLEVKKSTASGWFQDLKITHASATGEGVFVNDANAIVNRVSISTSQLYDGFKSVTNGVLTVMNSGCFGTVLNAGFSSYGDTSMLAGEGIVADVVGTGMRAVYGAGLSIASSDGGAWIGSSVYGILLNDCNKSRRLEFHNIHIEGSQYGIYSDNCTSTWDGLDIDNTSVETVHLEESEFISDTSLTGSGNVWGMDLAQTGNILYLSATPTIAGTSGEVTTDGTVATTWAYVVAGSPGAIFTGITKSVTSLHGATADPTDFYKPTLVVSNGDTGWNYSALHPAIVGEGKSTALEVGVGGLFVGQTSSARMAYGFQANGKASDATDTSEAVGFYAYAYDIHNGANTAASLYADRGTENYALKVFAGDIRTYGATSWDFVDNNAAAFSFDTDGLSCLLCFDTTNSAEKINTGATLELGAALDANGQLISDSTGAVKHGTGGTPGSAGVGDDYFGGDVEVDGSLNADGGINVGDTLIRPTYLNSGYYGVKANGKTYIGISAQTDDGAHVSIGNDDGYVNRRLVITDFTNYNKDHGHDTLATDPTINQHSVVDPTTGDNTQFNEITWNRMALGGSGGGYGCINQTFSYDDLTDGGGASGTLDLDEGIPDGAVVQQAVLHSLTGFIGDTSAVITVGDGTDVDRYNTGTPSVFTTNASGVALGVPSGTAWHDDAATVTVTVTSNADYTSVSAGQATILVCYWTP